MRILLPLFLLGGCAPAAEPRVAAPATIPAAAPTAREPIVLTDTQLGVSYGEYGDDLHRRAITLSERTPLTIMCTGRPITFTFDKNERSHAFACGPNTGYIGSGGPMVIRFEDHGPKYDVDVRALCLGFQTELVVSADRLLATIRCPNVDISESYDGDSAFVDYVIR